MLNNRTFLLRILVSSLIRRRSRIIVALVGIVLGAAVLLGMVTLCYDVPRQMEKEFRSYGANMIFMPAGKEKSILLEDVDRIVNLLPKEQLVGAAPYRYFPVNSHMLPYTAAGTFFDEVRKTRPYWQVQGKWPEGKNEILIGSDIAEATKLGPGAVIPLGGRNDAQVRFERDFTITGIVKTGGAEDAFIFMDLKDMHEMLNNADKRLKADLVETSIVGNQDTLKNVADMLAKDIPSIEPRLVKRVIHSEALVLGKLNTLVYLVTLVVLMLTTICVATTMMTVIMERRREIGLKKAIGAENKSIAREFLSEGIFLGVVGGTVGAVLGLFFAQIISASVFDRSISIEFYLIPVTITVSVAVTVLACLIPVRRAINIEPALVLRGE